LYPDSPITDVKIEKVIYPLKKPYLLSFTTLNEFSSLQVIIGLDGGEEKRAEVVPLFGYSEEDEDGIRGFLESVRTKIIGMTLDEARGHVGQFVPKIPFSASPYLTAIDLFSYPFDLSVELTASDKFIKAGSLGDLESLRHLIRQEHQAAIKVKLTGEIDYDIESIDSLKRDMAGRDDIRLDANQAYSGADAMQLCHHLTENQLWGVVKYLEQPCPATHWDETEQILKNCPDALIMLDESIVDLDDIRRARAIGVKSIKLKLFKQGGIRELIELSRFAHQKGLNVVLGNGVATRLANAVEIQVYNKFRKFFQAGCEANGFLRIASSPAC